MRAPGEIEQFLTTSVKITRAVGEAARGRADVSLAAAIPSNLGEWGATAAYMAGVQGTGKELKDISVVDFSRATPHDSGALCRQGLGTLIAKLADNVPLSLSTPATSIAWGNTRSGVDVDTPLGRIAARAVVVTVSTNVLASGRIRFTPDLPRRQLDAASALSLGSLDHIALEMPDNPLGLSAATRW